MKFKSMINVTRLFFKYLSKLAQECLCEGNVHIAISLQRHQY